MGSLHGGNVAAHRRLSLKWIADPNAILADRLAAETGARVTDLDEILADPAVKGVVVASSTDCHLAHSQACLRAGKAVFCEKPLSLSGDELLSHAEELSTEGLPLFVAFNRRFDPHFGALEQRLRRGEIGRLESLHIVNHDPAPPDPNFIPRSGGLFRDFSIHDLDLACWLLQQPIVEVFAFASCLIDPAIAALDDVDTAKIILRSANGALCVISNSRRTGYGYDQRIEAFGSKGALRVGNVRGDNVTKWEEHGWSETAFPFGFQQRYADGYRAELDHFADMIEHGSRPKAGFTESVIAIRLADAVLESVRLGQPVQLTDGGRLSA
jgi:myo-inositol 2-dehydrogenase/D-chiro-inositol 1-dehydrogenase